MTVSSPSQAMERLRNALRRPSSPVYEPLDDGSSDESEERLHKQRFSWLEYSIFLLLGISMLWAWNMFLAASPYFQRRFHSDPSLLSAYSPTLLSVSTATNLVSMGVLTYLQSNAHYPNRIILSLLLNIISFTLLALSTVLFRSISPAIYFTFLMTMVFLGSLATGLCQNGVFAYVSGFGMGEYTQAIMTGQGVAGVLPCIAQILSVLSVPPPSTSTPPGKSPDPIVPQGSGKSAFAYFLTATFVSLAALSAFFFLLRRHPNAPPPQLSPPTSPTSSPSLNLSPTTERESIPLLTLFKKLPHHSLAVFFTFALTMLYPVFTQLITTAHPPPLPRLLSPDTFIPLAFLFWNTGDLLGRLLALSPTCAKLIRWPKLLLFLSILRVGWVPLYELCNKRVVESDFFYLVVVQFGFGISSGVLGSCCMMGASDPEFVDEGEREAAGGWMGLCLVAGLTVGSLLSFLVV